MSPLTNQSELVQFQRFTEERTIGFSEVGFPGFWWADMAVLDCKARRSLKSTDFVIGDKLVEGSFGVVYSGAFVPKNVTTEERGQKIGRGRSLELDSRFKRKVILKKLKIGVQGAEEFGDFEEWFNYRPSRAAPETSLSKRS
ncbi:hypothetical protein ACOSP7_004653 [Xanthoceras sorbifolium]